MKLSSANKDLKSFDFSHDVVTTSNFGWWQPTLCHELVQGSSFNLRQQSFVRLSNMVAPTFGNIKLKNTFAFVPMRLLYPNFTQLLGGQMVSGSSGRFVPTEIPTFRLMEVLTHLIFSSAGSYTLYDDNGDIIEEYNNNPLSWDYVQPIGEWRFEYDKAINEHKYVLPLVDSGDGYLLLKCNDNLFFEYDSNADTPLYIGFTPSNADQYNINNYFKLFNGLGYTIPKNIFGSSVDFINGSSINPLSIYNEVDDLPLTCLPILAYTRFYYEHLSPQREQVFEDSICYRFIELFRDKNGFNISTLITSPEHIAFISIIRETLQNFYTLSPDIFTSALSSVNTDSYAINVRSEDDEVARIESAQSSVPYFRPGTDIAATAIQGLLKMLKYSNRNTIVGRNVVNWLQSRFGIVSNAEFNNHSYYLGTQNCDVSISDIYATANSEGSFGSTLGSYSGRGLGFDNGKSINFKAKEFGYLICLQCVVPVTGYYQGLKPHTLRYKRGSFYTTEFENLGYQSLPRFAVNAGAQNRVGTFGFIPRYADYKYITNTVNGDFANGYPAMEAYHLNRTFDSTFTLNETFRKLYSDMLMQGDRGYLRIFANTQQFVDHFLIFNRMNFDVRQPMDRISNSFDIEEHGNGSVDVNYT